MQVVQTFGNIVAAIVASERPIIARRTLNFGWRAQWVKYSLFPDRRLPPSRRYISRVSMEIVLRALEHPDRAAATSLFVPTEPLQAVGIAPYSVEAVSAYLTGTKCEGVFLDKALEEGASETECSYHRVFTGALESGLLPLPRFAVYTNLACDGNLITFPHLTRKFGVPSFLVDVPYEKSEDAVAQVADELREMCAFIEEMTGSHVEEDALSACIARERKADVAMREAVKLAAHRSVPSGVSEEMFPALVYHVMCGSEESLRYAELYLEDAEKAPETDSLRIVWMHLIPNMQPAVQAALSFSDDVHLTSCDIAYDTLRDDVDPARPFDAMARRMVYSPFNGPVSSRVERVLDIAEATDADGAVLFTQWGCKATIGAAPLIRKRLEEAGLPCLVLDGDGCDRKNASDGQTATRIEAFLEMLSARRAQGKGGGKAA